MLTYVTEVDNIAKFGAELPIDFSYLSAITNEQKHLLAVFILVLAEVRRIAQQLEYDRKDPMAGAARLLRKWNEALLFMASAVTVSSKMYYSTAGDDEIPDKTHFL